MPEGVSTAENGIGLLNLQQGLAALNGTLEIESLNGTSVYLGFDLSKLKGQQ